MEDPPLALAFSLDGVSPRLSHSGTPHLQGEWANVAMAMLRNVASNGGSSSALEVEVHADIKPGDRVVLYCDTKFGEVLTKFDHNHIIIVFLTSKFFSAQFQPVFDRY